MSTGFVLHVEGIGICCAGWPDWPAAQAALCGNVEDAPYAAPVRPAPSLLAAAERRRAPDSVLLAVEVAQQACTMAAREARDLPHVFGSAYGDLPINDYLCATLARAPLDLSPTKFHNSVHNAPAGYWTIATGCGECSTALSAGADTFGAALLEAGAFAEAEQRAVLLVAYDVAATGMLADVVDCANPFAVALVLAPPGVARNALAKVRVTRAQAADVSLAPGFELLHASHRDNPAARCLPLLAALARRRAQRLCIDAAPNLKLLVETLV